MCIRRCHFLCHLGVSHDRVQPECGSDGAAGRPAGPVHHHGLEGCVLTEEAVASVASVLPGSSAVWPLLLAGVCHHATLFLTVFHGTGRGLTFG